ncbi:replication initiator protein [Apis mellifera associated microvirus 25]|nr:replication initiator protein [Apis mellifera associated microvirus 25]
MQCTRPIKASFNYKGEITFSQKDAIQGLIGFSIPCSKCLACRLNRAREKAIRCVHESQMHENNIFLTLTYSDDHLKSPKLQYEDFQLFMKKLRKHTNNKLSYMVTGEYGEKHKRPHWHAIIFNYSPTDAKHLYTTDNGDRVYSSGAIDNIWGLGKTEFGSVTMDSANYVARYAAKKLTHGEDGTHDFEPIHRTSKLRPIGLSYLEKHYQHIFNHGYIVLPNGEKTGIPRYYSDWFKKNHPEKFLCYISTVKNEITKGAEQKARREELDYVSSCLSYRRPGIRPLTKSKIKETILSRKFKQLQERLKL